jgi:uncharacterized membrane protein YdjX (TVP38/TMEM64 family)
MKSHHKKRGLVAVILLLTFLLLQYYPQLQSVISNPEAFQQSILALGNHAPLAFMLIQFLQVFIPLIPGQFLMITAGFLFGSFWGTIYTSIAMLSGSLVSFLVARRYGKQFVHKLVDPKEIRHFNAFFAKRGDTALLIARVIPFFPNEVVSMLAGLTSIKTKDYLLISTATMIPMILLFNLFGERLLGGVLDHVIIIVGIIAVLSALFYVFRHQLKVFFLEEVRKVEEEMGMKKKRK